MLQVTFTATGPVGAGGACVAWMGDRIHEHWSLNLTKGEYSCIARWVGRKIALATTTSFAIGREGRKIQSNPS